jgi:hypothetical protein
VAGVVAALHVNDVIRAGARTPCMQLGGSDDGCSGRQKGTVRAECAMAQCPQIIRTPIYSLV